MPSTNGVRIDCRDTYMITIIAQQRKDYIEKWQLDEVIDYLGKFVPSMSIIHSVYEISGKYRQLHYHAIVKVKKALRYKQFTSFGSKDLTGNTYRIQWTRVYDYFKACAYLLKDLRYKTQDEIFIDNYYSVNRFNEIYMD